MSHPLYGAYADLFGMLAVHAMELPEFLAHQQYYSMKAKRVHITINNNIKEFMKKIKTKDKTNDESIIPIKLQNNEPKSINHDIEKFLNTKPLDDNVDNTEKLNEKTRVNKHMTVMKYIKS